MPLVVSDSGMLQVLRSWIRPGDVVTPDWTMHLFANNLTLLHGTPLSSFVEATFTGSDPIALDNSTFSSPVINVDRAESGYPADVIRWTNTGLSTQTVYGWFVYDGGVGDWLFGTKFATARVMSPAALLVVNLTLYDRNDPSPP